MTLTDNASPENVQLALCPVTQFVITVSERDHFERRLGFSLALLGQRELNRSHKAGLDGPSSMLTYHPSVAWPGW